MSKLTTLIVGAPNTGKTVSACTFPKPLLLIDIDDGVKSIDHAADASGKKIVPSREGITVETIVKTKVHGMNFQTVLKGKGSPAHASESGLMVNKINGIIKGIKEGDYRTVVVDSLTSFFRVWKEAILLMNNQPSLQKQDYLTLENVLYNQFIPTMKALPVDYVILIDHTNISKDEISGMVSEFPVGPSVNMGRNLPQAFDEVWRQDIVGGEYVWRTRKSGLFIGAGSRLHLLDPVKPANYQEIKKRCPTLP